MSINNKIITIIFAGILFVLINGCVGDDEYIKLVKEGNFKSYPNKTIGQSINAFFSNPKWESIIADDGKHYVNVKGGISYLEKDVTAALQFNVDLEKGTFEVTAFEINEVPQSEVLLISLIEKIFEEK